MTSVPDIDSCGLSVTGPVREENQDSIHVSNSQHNPDLGLLYAVADGMGGYSHGGIASALTLEVLTQTLFSLNSPDPKALRRAVENANLGVFQTAQRLGAGRMGTTLTAAYILGDRLHLAHVGDSPKPLGQIVLAASFAAFIGFLALRGITGTTPSSIILNTIQLTTLTFFSILAIVFRFTNPLNLSAVEWTHPSALSILLPPDFKGLIFQASLAMMLMVGFEAVTSLGAQAVNPKHDIPRATILSLVMQGIFAYLLVYFAAELALNTSNPLSASPAPLGDLAIQIGDSLLAGNGFALMFIVAFAVVVALLGALLTSMNNGVRISFSMALDTEMPDLFGVINPRYTTPLYTVIALSLFSALIGAIGILGGLPVLIGLILASNLGAFLLYAVLCCLTIAAFYRTPDFNPFRHFILPVLGLGLNLLLGLATPLIAISTSGILAQAGWVALGITALWLILSLVYYILRR